MGERACTVVAMTAILYPVAETAEAALHAARGYAARAREAQAIAAEDVAFQTELVGPAFATRDAALDAYVGRVEDGFKGGPVLSPDARWGELVPVSSADGVQTAVPVPAQPNYKNGRRWPDRSAAVILWRLSVSYWRIGAKKTTNQFQNTSAADAARQLRKAEAGRGLEGPALNALARQPLRPVRLQQPLDIGLFEVRPPEAPDTLIPDE